MNATILLGYQEAERRLRDASGVLSPVLHFREADLGLVLIVQIHSSRRDGTSDRPSSYAGTGLGRSPSISRRMSWTNSLGTATSAIWKVTYRACVTILAPILTSFAPEAGQPPVRDCLG